jgi:hypothetical protein
MKDKLLFIVCHGINKLGGGIGRKINSQVRAFQKTGIATSLSALEVDENDKYIGRSVNGELIETFKPVLGKNVSWKWRFKFQKLLKYIVKNEINVVYIRYSHFANPFFIHFLKNLKKRGVLILMEIPTFPYDNEYINVKFSTRIIKRIEEFYLLYFYKYVDRMVTFSIANKIFNVKTITIHNGIELNSIELKKSAKNGKDIHLIAVAVVNLWHGYDRLIEGLKQYYSTNPDHKVFLHIVGDSNDSISKKYNSMVLDYNLGNYVSFHGFQTGEALSQLFDGADMAVGPLGFHRVGVDYVTPIKFGEYCARGIPFVYSGRNDLFENQPFIYKVPDDETPVDIAELVAFVNSNTFDPVELRKFAEENLTWEIQMKKIMDSIS